MYWYVAENSEGKRGVLPINFIKVTGYNFNFARAIINLYTKHWAVSAENFGVSFRGVKTLCDRIYGLF